MKYIAFFDTTEYKAENRSVAPSASNVVRYMADVMSEFINVEIISPSRTLNKSGFYKGRKNDVAKNITLIQPPTFGADNKIMTLLAVIQVRVWLFLYLLIHVKRNEHFIVYHSLSYMNIIRFIKRMKNAKIIEEIREIYADVKQISEENKVIIAKQREKEKNFFQIADKYIFPTDALNKLINIKSKPYILAPGIYRPERKLGDKLKDGFIHVVYAGTLRPEKGGAATAVEVAAYLPSLYYVHILGYGSDEAVEQIKMQIDNVMKTSSHAKVSYDGLLRGDEFSSFLQSCHIGLVTQDTSGVFNNTSFPSKILTYLVNDLEVISGRIEAVENSPVGIYLHYYDHQNPKCIAEAIQMIKTTNSVSNNIHMQKLDEQLRREISILLENN